MGQRHLDAAVGKRLHVRLVMWFYPAGQSRSWAGLMSVARPAHTCLVPMRAVNQSEVQPGVCALPACRRNGVSQGPTVGCRLSGLSCTLQIASSSGHFSWTAKTPPRPCLNVARSFVPYNYQLAAFVTYSFMLSLCVWLGL